MVYLEKIEISNDLVKYYYYESKGTQKGILIYKPQTDECEVEKLCEGDEEYYRATRQHAFHRIIQYVKQNNYPDKDIVAWG